MLRMAPAVGALALVGLLAATNLAAMAQDDERRLAAQKLVAEADKWVGEGTTASYKKAIALYEEALREWRAIGDRREEAQTLGRAGYAHSALRDHQKAIDHYRQAASLWEALNDRRGLAATYDALGEAHLSAVGSREALDYLTRALGLWESIGDRAGEGRTLTNLGEVYHVLGQNQKALDYLRRALPLSRDAGDVHGEIKTAHDIGMIHFYQGDGQQAVDSLMDVVSRTRRLNDRGLDDPHFLGSLARAHAAVGDWQRALDAYAESLRLWRAVGDRWGEGLTLGNLARTYHEIGQHEQALDRYREALTVFRATGSRAFEARTLEQMGRLHAASGRNGQAFTSLLRAQSLLGRGRDPQRESDTLHSLGTVYAALNQDRRAVTFFQRALALKRSLGDRRGEAESLHGLGELYASERRYADALEPYQGALTLRRAGGDRDGEAATLCATARVERDQGRVAAARSATDQALAIVESLRSRVVNQAYRTSYTAIRQGCYELSIELLMRQHEQEPGAGYDALALEASERARARSLLESLAEARADIRVGVDAALIDRERALQRALNAKEQARTRMLSANDTKEQAEAAEAELRSLLADYEEVQARIRAVSPRYAALTQPQPLRLAQIREHLTGDTLLIEYSLGEERSFAWAVSRDSLTTAILPPRAALERDARQLHYLLRAGGNRLAQGQLRLALARMSGHLLQPVASGSRKERLLVVPDGAIHYVPFAALPLLPHEPGRAASAPPGSPTRQPRWGGEALTREIIHLPSASAMALLGAGPAGDRTGNDIAVFADPVFDARDERVARAKGSEATVAALAPSRNGSVPSDRERAARDSGATLTRLKFSRHEANAIAAVVPEEQAFQALDFRASRATLAALDLSRYRILHFATHALVNSRHPELSGVVLSLVNEQGQAQDGFLRVHEIYGLKLAGDLVVLSACQTALGKEVRGEGLLGLTQAFMYAGARRVVVSLWNVSDEATAELMKRFYSARLIDGLRPGAALRAAQVGLSQEPRWAAPYYWAGFVLQGEWN